MTERSTCPSCGNALDPGTVATVASPGGLAPEPASGEMLCPHCGARIDAPVWAIARDDVPAALPEFVCPRCQAPNTVEATRCANCRGQLLPGRRASERVAYAVGCLVMVAAFVGLIILVSRMEEPPPCLASPFALAVLALASLGVGIKMTLGRTPLFERHVKRAETNLESSPESALADLSLALTLAPERESAAILKMRGELLARLGRKEEAVADLARYAADPRAHGGANVVSKVIGIDVGQAAGAPVEARLAGLRNDLIRAGSLAAVGYCNGCHQASILGEGRVCPNCGQTITEPVYVQPGQVEAELVRLRKEGDAAWRARRRRSIVVGVLAGLLILCAATGIILAILDGREDTDAPAKTDDGIASADAGIASADAILQFDCPANWLPITTADVDVLLATSLEGLEADALTHVGGCYLKGVGDCDGCAQIVSLVVLAPDMPGTLTDEQYESVKAATERQMGSRLESFHGVEISSMPGVESIHIGKSGRTKLQDLIIVPPEPGILYMLSASTDLESWNALQPVFEQAISSLRIVGDTEAVPAATAPPDSTPRVESTQGSVPTLKEEPPASPAVASPPPATQAPSAAVAGTAVVTTEALNVRSGPGTGYASIAGLARGDSTDVLARSAEGDWLYVRCPDGTAGWISARHVALSVPVEVIPVATATPAP